MQNSSPISAFWQGKVQNSSPSSALLTWRHFRLTLSLSPSAPHAQYRKRFGASYNDLSNIGVRGSALKWFINYLTDRQQQVRCGNTVSAPTSCSRGVPQGSVLGPLLFLLYTRKVPEVLSATKTIKSVLFADDILIYCSGRTPTTLAACLSEAATRLRTWLAERGLCINVNKTKAMLLPPKHQQCPADILIQCCDATLSIVNEFKYLGVIDSTLSWEAHVDSMVSKVAKKIGTLRRAGNSLTQAARRQYYLSVIQSDLQYGANVYWTTLTNARQNRLIRSSKRALRAVINAPTTTPTKTILSLLNLPPPPPPWNTSETQTACSHFPMHTQQGKHSPLCTVPSSITHSQHTPHHQSTNIHLTYYSTCQQISWRKKPSIF